MPKLKRKTRRSRKRLGKRYHGYGQVSGGHRKSGQRGGKGRAGSKDHMKLRMLKMGVEFGSRGFTRPGPIRSIFIMNIGELADFIKEGKISASKKDGKYVIDLSTLRRAKILGGGKVDIPMRLHLSKDTKITDRAKEKILSAGGEIIEAE